MSVDLNEKNFNPSNIKSQNQISIYMKNILIREFSHIGYKSISNRTSIDLFYY